MRRVNTLATWEEWMSVSSKAPPAPGASPGGAGAGGVVGGDRDRLLEQVLVAAPMNRSMTVAHLQSAASLLREGYGTSDELSRLELLCSAACAFIAAK